MSKLRAIFGLPLLQNIAENSFEYADEINALA
jgi:hypothetical protein